MKKGFTILELLVVISVLVILIGIAIPRFKGMQDAGRIAQAKAELRTMQTAVESYYMNLTPNGYPPCQAACTTSGATYFATAVPQIIPATPPYDPFGATSTTEYRLLVSTNGKYYVLSSVGVDGTNATTAVTSQGTVTTGGDDICISNGSGCS